MSRILYYGYGSFLGALLAFLIVCLYTETSREAAGVGTIALLVVLFIALQHEFSIPRNTRAVGFVFVLFASVFVSTLASLYYLA